MKEEFLYKKINERKEQNSFRQLVLPRTDMIDFCSNDYLGIVKNQLLKTPEANYGATGSRLLTGNYKLIEETEKFIAAFHNAEAALIFNSGYDANIGLLSSVPQRGDIILYDYLSHASIRDGIRLSFAESFSFKHNDLNDLEIKLKKVHGNPFVVTESVFSMDGDMCPLRDLIDLCKDYDANLIVDEAHGTGIIGEQGEGLVQKMQMETNVFARIHTFGKALGVHGAAVLGSFKLKDYLINFARSFIYSTALPEQTITHIKASYELFPALKTERSQLNKLIDYFRNLILDTQPSTSRIQAIKNSSAIQALIVPGNDEVKKMAGHLHENNLDVRPILYPTVPKGQERLRIVLHSFNTEAELDSLVNCLQNRS